MLNTALLMQNLKLKEIKNARLAMLGVAGFFVQVIPSVAQHIFTPGSLENTCCQCTAYCPVLFDNEGVH